MTPNNLFPPPPAFPLARDAKDGTCIHFGYILLKISSTFMMLLSSVVALIFTSAVTSGKRLNFVTLSAS